MSTWIKTLNAAKIGYCLCGLPSYFESSQASCGSVTRVASSPLYQEKKETRHRCLQCAFSRLTLSLGGLPNAQLTHDQGFPGTENLFIIHNHRERFSNVLDIWLLHLLLKVLAKDSEAGLYWILFAKEKIFFISFFSWGGLIFS